VTTEQMIEVDRIMIEEYRIDLIQMMENAGRTLAELARIRFLNGDPRGRPVAVLAGTGGNGGGALAAARRLHNYGAEVHVFILKPDDRFTPVPAHQLAILRHMKVSVDLPRDLPENDGPWDVIIDGLIGYSLEGAPRGAARDLILWANGQSAPVLALDAPSGIDAGTGTVFEPAIQAAATMTLALPKEGLRHPDVARQVGELYLADISVPPALYAAPSLGLEVGPIFAAGDIVQLR
jgi:NAD(P)H-hydrate epimerase